MRSLTFARDAFLRVRLARVRTERGEFAFVAEASPRQDRVLGIHALEGAGRLIELILKGARLASTGPGAEVYERN